MPRRRAGGSSLRPARLRLCGGRLPTAGVALPRPLRFRPAPVPGPPPKPLEDVRRPNAPQAPVWCPRFGVDRSFESQSCGPANDRRRRRPATLALRLGSQRTPEIGLPKLLASSRGDSRMHPTSSDRHDRCRYRATPPDREAARVPNPAPLHLEGGLELLLQQPHRAGSPSTATRRGVSTPSAEVRPDRTLESGNQDGEQSISTSAI